MHNKLLLLKFFLTITILLLLGCEKNEMQDDEFVIDSPYAELANNLFDSEVLKESLKEIEDFHVNNQTGITLKDPLSDEDFSRGEKIFNCKFPEELKILWSWHNGEDTDKYIWYHRFLSLEDSIKEYKSLIANEYSLWKNNWVPVFEFQEEWYGISCGKEQQNASTVYHYFIEQGLSVAYINLTTYMSTMRGAMKADTVRWVEDWWEIDIKELADFHSRFNQDIKFPYHVPE